jgi:hypothetical protein
LTHDDPDNIYVIGIGLSRHLTMTPEKARREGIRCVDIESVYWQCGLKFDKIRSCGNGLFLLCPYSFIISSVTLNNSLCAIALSFFKSINWLVKTSYNDP